MGSVRRPFGRPVGNITPYSGRPKVVYLPACAISTPKMVARKSASRENLAFFRELLIDPLADILLTELAR